jgi:hypothetical protein
MDKNEEQNTTPPSAQAKIKKRTQAVFINRMIGNRPPCGGCRK